MLDFTWNFSIDTTPPTVIDYSPTGSDVPVEAIVRVTFSEEMNRTSVEDAFSMVPVVNGSFIWDNNTLKFVPHRLTYGIRYNVRIKGDAKDLAGNSLDGDGDGTAEGSPCDDSFWLFTTVTLFDAGPGTYPSIFGVHKGNITPAHNVTVNQMYTYPCVGTGGHSEFVELDNGTFYINATWKGYHGDYHNITFPYQFTLLANHTYNYTIRTGSYPQIHHTDALPTPDGWINCTQFTDANGRIYHDWIPAIRLWAE